MSPDLPFRDPEHPHGDVLFNFRRRHLDDLIHFAVGYRTAGAKLAAALADSPSYSDYEGYPILFLYRHALELSLKAVLVHAYRLADLVADDDIEEGAPRTPRTDLSPFWRRHSLTHLFRDVEAVLSLLEPQLPGGVEFLRERERVVMHVARIDDSSYVFRYPVTTRGEAAHPSSMRVNALLFAKEVGDVCEALEGASTHLREGFQLTAEIKYKVQELLSASRQA